MTLNYILRGKSVSSVKIDLTPRANCAGARFEIFKHVLLEETVVNVKATKVAKKS